MLYTVLKPHWNNMKFLGSTIHHDPVVLLSAMSIMSTMSNPMPFWYILNELLQRILFVISYFFPNTQMLYWIIGSLSWNPSSLQSFSHFFHSYCFPGEGEWAVSKATSNRCLRIYLNGITYMALCVTAIMHHIMNRLIKAWPISLLNTHCYIQISLLMTYGITFLSTILLGKQAFISA